MCECGGRDQHADTCSMMEPRDFALPKFGSMTPRSDSPFPVNFAEWDVPLPISGLGTSELLLARRSMNRTLVYIENTSTGGQIMTVVFKDRTKLKTLVAGAGFNIRQGSWRVWDECGECAVSPEEIRVIFDASGGTGVYMEGRRISRE